MQPDTLTRPTVTVVICAYTERRWDQIVRAVKSIGDQSLVADQVVVVIDHNPELLARARAELTHVDVIPNTNAKGLSGARNTGIEHSAGEIVAFLDDDANAEPTWLEALIAPYEHDYIFGTGGVARPAWPDERPAWMPSEFEWVVGCSYRGLPTELAEIRNPIGAGMSFRREAFEIAGQFACDFGRQDTLPLGCEETEFSIRLRWMLPESRIVHVPDAIVDHSVSGDRTTPAYFVRRCLAEGLSKSAVAALAGDEGLASERTYITKTLPMGFLKGFVPGMRDWSPQQSVMIAVGLAATSLGFILGRFKLDGVVNRLLAKPSATAAARASTPVKAPGHPVDRLAGTL